MRGTQEDIVAPRSKALADVRARLDSFSFCASAFEYYGPLQRLLRYVEQNPDELIGLAEAAAIGGQERHHFCAFFHRKVGVRFSVWNSHRRMMRALTALATIDDTITRVAEHSGFSDLRTFERHCVRWTGMAPKRIREVLRLAGSTERASSIGR
ncbi:MAG TPA: AraC family transcriptional regulator [Terriglobia bacterium]|nr:AraC family transcriptional regulator [Terriglobia bacterium]